MKTARDPRHRKRQEIVQHLYTYSYSNLPHADETTQHIVESIDAIDKSITEIAPDFPIDKINKVDLAVLRLAVYELAVEKKEPPKVVIDEAIELAKEFGGETSPAFVNGALGKLLKGQTNNEQTT